ncbi:MAG: hypothetical protein HQL31_13900, partial [Planctomycetes bacterium]|nr:hypothetical protein [Planctomycetota bacterium]
MNTLLDSCVINGKKAQGAGGMTQRERLLAAFKGEEVDCAPVWLREGFDIAGQPASADDFSQGWQADPGYREFLEWARPHVAAICGGWIPNNNRLLMVSPKYLRHTREEKGPDIVCTQVHIDTRDRELVQVIENRRGENTGWVVQKAASGIEDLDRIISLPFEIDPRHIDIALEGYRKVRDRVGEQGLPCLVLSSPIVIISGAMEFGAFLELSFTQSERLLE